MCPPNIRARDGNATRPVSKNWAFTVSPVSYNGYALGLENLTETSTIILTDRSQKDLYKIPNIGPH